MLIVILRREIVRPVLRHYGRVENRKSLATLGSVCGVYSHCHNDFQQTLDKFEVPAQEQAELKRKRQKVGGISHTRHRAERSVRIGGGHFLLQTLPRGGGLTPGFLTLSLLARFAGRLAHSARAASLSSDYAVFRNVMKNLDAIPR